MVCGKSRAEGRTFASAERFSWIIGTVLLAGLVSGCVSTAPPRRATPLPAVAVEDLDERALLLLLADRKSYDPLAAAKALGGGEELRRQAALTMARIGDLRGGPVLESLLGDASPRVRRAATFGLGELGEVGPPGGRQTGRGDGSKTLLGLLTSEDRETGRLAVESLAKLGVPLETVVGRLIEAPSEELFPRLLPSLFRFEGAAVVRWAEQGLEQEDSRPPGGGPAGNLHAMAAYALGRNPLPEGAALLRPLLADADPWVRGWAARGLGTVGERDDVLRLRPLLDDPAPGPIIQALRAARRLIEDAKVAPPRDWTPRLLELMADPRPGVRLTAIEVSAVWLLDEDLSAALLSLAASGLRRERELAWLALAEGEDPRATALMLQLAGDPDPVLRARAAEAAGFLRAVPVLDRLAGDDNPGVRVAAFDTRLAGEPPDAAEWVRLALEDPDPAVRASALGWAEDHPVIDMRALLAAMATTWHDRIADARVTGVRALAARAVAVDSERDAVVAVLEELTRDRDLLVRRAAARALADLGEEPPPVGTVRSGRTVEAYRQIVQRTAGTRRVDLVTDRGTIGLELACPEAPLTCLNFLQLAAQGYYEGLSFHRVVPDFVVQAGDPRGDGWGGPGYAIRDEINTLRYRRGAVGMALSGPDTGGSQFFITLAPQPHLDGGYTVFGQVVAGDDVLYRIVQGDLIQRIVEVPPQP